MKARPVPLLRAVAAGLAVVVWAPGVDAQVAYQSTSELKRMTVEELLRQKVISVSRMPETLGETPSSVFLIRGEGARGTGAVTLPEVMRLAPNLFVAQSSAYDWAVGARGFTRANSRVDKMLVLIDGRTVYSPLFSGVFWEAQDVFLPDLDRVEVISGPAGVTWGANAVNGVINIVTKPASETLGGNFYAGIGAEARSNFGLRYGGRAGDDRWYRVYAKRMSFDETLAADGESPGADAWDFTQAGFRVDGGDEEAEWTWSLHGDAYVGHYDNPAGVRGRNEGANVVGRVTRRFPDQSEFTVRFYQDYTLRDLEDTVVEHLRTSDVELQLRRSAGDGRDTLWGVHYRYMNESVENLSPSFAFLPAEAALHLVSVFVQDRRELSPGRLRLITGVRLEHNTYSGFEVQPSVRLAWTVAPEHTVWTAVSRATRTPSRIDTDFYAPRDPPQLLVGGPDFTSETLYAYELGWRGKLLDDLAASATAFYHDYHRLRSFEPGPPLVIENGLDGRSVGAELFLDWQVRPWWRLRAGCTLLDESTSFRPGGADIEGGLGEASDPRYQLHYRSGFELTRALSLWLGFRSIGSVPAYANGADAGRVPAYTELDANLRWLIRPDLEFALTGRNLLHASHPEIGPVATRHEIQREVRATIRWTF